ncbi:MAG: phosphatidylglycerol lysyltransferase domain-containing protein [Flavitalea sp.]
MNKDLRKKFSSISPKAYWREILAVLMLLLAIVFFRNERKELQAIIPQISQANPLWLMAGIIMTIIYFFAQGGMYRKSFSAIGLSLSWGNAVALFLKRNLISIFLPAGGVSALAYSPAQLRKTGFNKTQVHQASGLFGFAGLLTVFLAGLPVVAFIVLQKSEFKNAGVGLISLMIIIALLFLAGRSIKQKGLVYQWTDKQFPSVIPFLDELFSANVSAKQFSGAVLYSLGVELSGMLHVYLAMLALGVTPSFGASASAYIIAVLMMVVSPFLRGLGAVELSMVYVLEQFGYNSAHALSITVLYRVFEFWLPLIAGLFSFAWKGRKLFLRLAPAVLICILGIINIISVVTPPIHQRLRLLREYLPLGAIHASNLLVLFIGLMLLVTSAFLFRGLRSAWMIALVLSVFSLIGHLTKAFDWEEASLALITVIVLIATASQYSIRSNAKRMKVGLKTGLLSFVAMLIFGFISFYFIDKRHFGIDFSWKQSLLYTFKSFLLVEDTSLYPVTRFGNEFVWLIRGLGFFTWGFLLFSIITPRFRRQPPKDSFRDKARFLLSQYGNSSMDYFKLYRDKLFFFSDIHEAFVAYRVARGFAVVLEEPVCAEEHKMEVLEEFDRHCRKMGLKPAFYRVNENSIHWFNQLKKQKLMIGQEAILEINNFTLEGKDKKSLRNGLNALQKKGYEINYCTGPQTEEMVAKLKVVSDEWLESYNKEELIFSQGLFDEKEIAQQDIIVLNDIDGNIQAFLNIIPDYTEDEITYDLIRKTNNAPGAAMDALIVKLIDYAKAKKKTYLNLGLVPMSGIIEPDNTAEQIIKLAAEKIKRFNHYKGLREFKEKYATIWENKYLVYDSDFDLLQLPIALNKIMKP